MRHLKVFAAIFLYSIIYIGPAISQKPLTFEEFGAKGNGKDETEQILHAIKHAREEKAPIQLLGKVYKFSPQETVDITGIPAFTGNGTIDASQAGPNAGHERMNYLFTVIGKKSLLQSNVKDVRQGKNEIILNAGLNLSKGDILFFASVEPLPNTKRKYNRKGQRAIVKSYEAGSGRLMITDSFYFTIINASVWKNDEQPVFQTGSGVRFITSPMNFMSAIQLVYAKANISGYFENFALAGIYFRSSEGTVENAVINMPINKNNGYSYGVAVSDMSDVLVKNCTIQGGRHTVCGTSGGLWRADESGGSGKEKLGYPAVVIIDGGTYKTEYNINAGINEHLGTIDSHGSVYKITVKNCTVYGGISLGANYGEVNGVTVFTDKKRAFNFGSDVRPGSEWGNYKISNVTVKVETQNAKSLLFGKADVEKIELDSIKISEANENTVIADFKDYAPKRFIIRNMEVYPNQSNPKIWINDKSNVTIEKSSFDKKAVKLIKREALPVSDQD